MDNQLAEKLSSVVASFTFHYHSLIISEIQKRNLYQGEQDEFLYTIIFKTNSALDSLSLLFCNFYNKNHFQPSIFIILRSILNDIILTEYINNQGKTDAERVKLIKRVKYDHIEKSITNISKIFKITNKLSDEEVNKEISLIKENYPTYFGENGEAQVKKLPTSPQSLISTIFCQAKEGTDLSFLRRAIHFYDIYSKYEHYGHFSPYLIHRPYKEKEDSFEEATETINMIMSALINYTRNWKEFGDDVRKPLEEIHKNFQELIRGK